MSHLHQAARFVRREAVRSPRGTGLFALALVLLVALAGVSGLPQAQAPRAAATGALSPAMQGATRVDGAMAGAATWFAGNRDAARENQSLRQENRALAAQLAQLQATERQNSVLRSELGLRRDHLVTTGATVIARDPDGLERTFTIDQGGGAGVRPGQAVVADAGLVGVVRSVTARSAQVETTAEPAFEVPVLTASTQLAGTARGGRQALSVRLLITGQTQPQAGEGVVTAGGGAIPGGLPLGRLTTVKLGGQTSAVAHASLAPFSDPAQAAQVVVVRAVRG